jgi:uncharacterized GH25 family protein
MRASRRLPRSTAAFVLLLLGAAVAEAHDFWAVPATWEPRAGETFSVRLFVGDHFAGEEFPRSLRHAKRFEILTEKGVVPVAGEHMASPAGRVSVAEPGLAWVVYRSTESVATVEPATFAAYLEQEGNTRWLDDWIARDPERAQPVVEAFSRCVKALVHVGGDAAGRAADAPQHARVVGLALEIVPEVNPLSLRPGGTLPVRLLLEGRPLAGQRVAALHGAEPQTPRGSVTDTEGRATLVLDRPGVWLLKSVHLDRARPDEPFAYRSLWTSLTFELPAPAATAAADVHATTAAR